MTSLGCYDGREGDIKVKKLFNLRVLSQKPKTDGHHFNDIKISSIEQKFRSPAVLTALTTKGSRQ